MQHRGTVIQQGERLYSRGERLYSRKSCKFGALFQAQPVEAGIRTPLRRGVLIPGRWQFMDKILGPGTYVSTLNYDNYNRLVQKWPEHAVILNPPCYFLYRMGGLKATTKWVFIGHFVVRPLSEKPEIPLQRMQTRSFCREK